MPISPDSMHTFSETFSISIPHEPFKHYINRTIITVFTHTSRHHTTPHNTISLSYSLHTFRRRPRNTGGLKVLPEKTNFAEELDAAGYTRSTTRIHVQRFG
ncbi:hypothetical protein Hanom_Chr14g01254401 [Helianthus anomalus]